MTTELDSIRPSIGVATFATSTFMGMLLMMGSKQRLVVTLIFAAITVVLMRTTP